MLIIEHLKAMNKILLTILILFAANQLFAQNEIKISDGLILYPVSEHCYMHEQGNNNGLVYINNGEALIVSTPDPDEEIQNLIDWVQDKQYTKIVAYIIDC